MSPWDLLPLIPIIKGAGGIITDYQGNDSVNGSSAVASSPQIHSEIISILNS
jgi:myo-inositol-1(or 4)-monophosphatase